MTDAPMNDAVFSEAKAHHERLEADRACPAVRPGGVPAPNEEAAADLVELVISSAKSLEVPLTILCSIKTEDQSYRMQNERPGTQKSNLLQTRRLELAQLANGLPPTN
jgi:hypothetical protein